MGAASPSNSMIVATVAPRPTLNVTKPRCRLERATFLATLDITAAEVWCTMVGMMVVADKTTQFPVLL